MYRNIEIWTHENGGVCQEAFQGDKEQKGPDPLSVSFTIEEHPIDERVQPHLQQNIEQEDGAEDGYQVVLRVENIGVADIVEGIEIIERGEEDAGEEDDEPLEAHLGERLPDGGGAIEGRTEEVLDLTGEETSDIGIGNERQDGERQQERGEGIVGAHAIRDGLACHASTPCGQFRVKEGVFRKESLLIVQGKFHDGRFLHRFL